MTNEMNEEEWIQYNLSLMEDLEKHHQAELEQNPLPMKKEVTIEEEKQPQAMQAVSDDKYELPDEDWNYDQENDDNEQYEDYDNWSDDANEYINSEPQMTKHKSAYGSDEIKVFSMQEVLTKFMP